MGIVSWAWVGYVWVLKSFDFRLGTYLGFWYKYKFTKFLVWVQAPFFRVGMGMQSHVLCFLIPNYITTFRVVGTATYDGAARVSYGAVMWCQTGKGKVVKKNPESNRYSKE